MLRRAVSWHPALMKTHPSKKPTRVLVTFLLTAVTALAGCGEHSHAKGKPTGATCPTTQTLTYENFGRSFFDTYCQRCHGSTVTGAARNGAPADHSFDDVLDIRTFAGHIDEHAGSGPNATNRVMPPSAPTPTDEQRVQLSQWLACQAP